MLRKSCAKKSSEKLLVGAQINCSLLQSGGGGGGGKGSLNGTRKFNIGLQITTLEVDIYHYYDVNLKNGTSFGALFI